MFWRKKDKSSPSESSASTNPFESSDVGSTPAASYSSTSASEYPPSYSSSPAPSRGGGRYGTRHNDAEYESQQRNELFGDRPSRGAAGGRYGGGYDDDQYGGSRYAAQQQQEEEDEEVGNIKTQIRNVKQDTLASTRNALQKIHETEQTAANTMNMLGQQSTQIANVDRNLDLSKAYSDRAANQADELKQLNRSIFIPVVKNPFTRNKRQQRELEALKRDQQEHMEERDRIRQFEYESNARLEQAQKRNERVSANAGYSRGRSESDRRRYQFEADEEDDAIEDEIDQNLDLLGGATARLKNMALTMNEEIDSQNRQLDKLNPKIDPLTQKLAATTHKLNKTK
ncbi:plasma membrane snare protein [Lichtheimia corymbifera JMRC:FSU:9682]|uniref:Plasma membrane snare protein n=1 Tax=Lichtheimia corymbifera JMRC:FSU:9682 TaxID=1263082 RepID=A0A068RME8_9FUNG|nr:plasma membrane snare protein [Lichtheimia corymbifera JMRC:FSU:9682]